MNESKKSPNGNGVPGGVLAAKDERDRRRLARRVFLSALGLGLSVPLAASSARLAIAQSTPRPRRLFLFYLPHGAPVEHFDPSPTGDLDLAGSGVLGPLAPYQSQVSVLRGISMNGASNHAAIRTILTGNADGAGSDSIDALIAQQLNTTAYVLGAVPYAKGSGFTSDSFLVKHGSWVRPEEDPARAADALFQGLGSTPDAGPNPAVEFRTAALAHALTCGTASVITLQNMYTNADLNMGFPGGPGVPKGHHEPVSHSWDAAGRSEFAMVQRWFYGRLADKLLATLNQTDPQDPEHTALDNSLVAVLSEVSDGANHNSDASPVWVEGKEYPTSLPLVLIGGAGGYLKPAGGAAQVTAMHTDLLATFAEAMGAPVSSMGAVSMKPLAELKA